MAGLAPALLVSLLLDVFWGAEHVFFVIFVCAFELLDRELILVLVRVHWFFFLWVFGLFYHVVEQLFTLSGIHHAD